MAASFIVQRTLTSRIEKYSKTPLSSGLSGKEVAEKMLRDNGIYDVQVTCTGGFLTDHYDPTKKTVNLSQGVFEGRNIASAAVSQLSQWVLLAGIILMSLNMLGIGRWVLLVGIGFFALTTLFSIITLPVEYNASERAVEWLDSNAITTGNETAMAKDALKWAARTYLIAALSSLATLLYYLSIFLGSRRD